MKRKPFVFQVKAKKFKKDGHRYCCYIVGPYLRVAAPFMVIPVLKHNNDNRCTCGCCKVQPKIPTLNGAASEDRTRRRLRNFRARWNAPLVSRTGSRAASLLGLL